MLNQVPKAFRTSRCSSMNRLLVERHPAYQLDCYRLTGWLDNKEVL
jgi:hypothetical protein